MPESGPGTTVNSTGGPAAVPPSGTVSGLIALLSWATRLPKACWDCAGPGNGGTNSEGGVAVESNPVGRVCALGLVGGVWACWPCPGVEHSDAWDPELRGRLEGGTRAAPGGGDMVPVGGEDVPVP